MPFKKGIIPWNKGLKGLQPYHVTSGLDLGRLTGKNHHSWKGENASYSALHYWLRRRLGKPDKCSECGEIRKCVWANISGTYMRKLNDYKSLCYSCHFYFDKVGERAWQTRRGVAQHSL